MNIEDIVTQSFVTRYHKGLIENACMKLNVLISFREAGVHTIKRLDEGAAAKGHDILEKSIKEKSIKSAYERKEKAKNILDKTLELDITGFVGHMQEDDQGKHLSGIYLAPGHGLSRADYIERGGHQILNLDFETNDFSQLENLKSQYPETWQTKLYTGDYDTHDILSLRGKPHSVVSSPAKGSEYTEENVIIRNVNKIIRENDMNRYSGLDEDQKKYYDVIRHGPQVNYNAFAMAEEKLDELVEAVAKPDFPIVFCDNKGRWEMINDIYELDNYYKKHDAHLKYSWKPGVNCFENSGKRGMVKMRINKRKSLTRFR